MREWMTYQDAIELCLDLVPDDRLRTDAVQRTLRRVTVDALEELVGSHSWTYYHPTYRFTTIAPYSAGTVSVVASTGVVTLSGGTWPTPAAQGRVLISGVPYDVAVRDSNTQVTLEANSRPPADITAASYMLFFDSYDLPYTVQAIEKLVDLKNNVPVSQVVSHQWSMLYAGAMTQPVDYPAAWAVMPSPNSPGEMAIRFAPPPSQVMAYDCSIRSRPRPLIIEKHNTGSVSVTGTTVTGVSTNFDVRMVGSIIRISSGPSAPTSRYGSNPAFYEGRISRYVSATSVELESAPLATISNAGYIVSDPVDIGDRGMMSAFRRILQLRFMEFAAAQGMLKQDSAVSATMLRGLRDSVAQALEAARAADSQVVGDTSQNDYGYLDYKITGVN